MSFPILAQVIAAALQDKQHNAVRFIWHGGEPTLLPISFFLKALVVQSRFRRSGQLLENTIQTNGTRLTSDWCRFFREYGFTVSVSLDGPPEVHNRQRPTVSGRTSWNETRKGISTLKEHGIPISVLMVVDATTIELGPDRVFQFFLEEGISSYGLIAATPVNVPSALPGTPAEHYTNPTAMNQFLIGIHKRWAAHGDSSIKIRELEALRDRLAMRDASSCTLAGGCLGQYYIVEPSGEVAHCDLFVGDLRYTLGHIDGQRDFSSFRRSSRLVELKAENAKSLAAMQGCPYFKFCNGWCPHERYLSVRHNILHRSECCGLYDLIQHLLKHPGAAQVLDTQANDDGQRVLHQS